MSEANLLLISSFFLGAFIFSTILYLFLKTKYEGKLQALSMEANQKLQALHEKISYQKELYEQKLLNKEEAFFIKKQSLDEKIALLEDSKEKMKVEFENLANKLFDENSKKSTININQILTPLKEQINSFGKRVNDIHSEETKQRSYLLNEIKNLKELNQQISNDAINLTKALKGDNKIQGDWGELILAKVLEQSGLRQGVEYTTQSSFNNNDGKRLRPDVIVHLPLNKDIVIDSKVSLNAYLNYTNSQTTEDKEKAIKELILSLKTHIKGLSSKKYEEIKEVRTLDFVLMFIPIEAAFLLAISKDNSLFKLAFENNIMLVSPSTLYVSLRTIENIWKLEYQNQNAELISKKAAALYDKFALFVKDIEEIGVHINRTSKAYESALNKLSTGKGNLLNRSQEFLDLGVKPNKQINTTNLLEI
ncbi:DNA recombination protein RmuC [Malaciobacter mytili LMG 24559]|uniref:DNA recombination protein RmuC n=1 Tax=Malaciobacter mytili LMG 24559 TaxID=1032238 RepID=A0AAX2AFV9_9BACT|nr:DNA recombination protein RmuC [Malaciobacter mytili]AXH15104.1 DNA recombination protein [Malaciobacter mytili LMG 24559]RXK15614.1 DNA recombination protein RmuC [Malaciobacter mytili LMG 24559]